MTISELMIAVGFILFMVGLLLLDWLIRVIKDYMKEEES